MESELSTSIARDAERKAVDTMKKRAITTAARFVLLGRFDPFAHL